LRVTVVDDYAAMSAAAAGLVAGLVWAKPDAVLGLPTGATPEGLYRSLVDLGPRFSAVRTFNLDEYVGIPADHPQSYAAFMQAHLFAHVDLRPGHIHIPDGMAADLVAECDRYEEAIRCAGGIDLSILGLGLNGHIGFNEPGAPWGARTRPVDLTELTRQANARFFRSRQETPRKALTMGIRTILESRRILLLASGASKAGIVQQFLDGPVTAEVPATVLRSHPDVVIMLDRAAAGQRAVSRTGCTTQRS